MHELPNLLKIESINIKDKCERDFNNKESLERVLREIHNLLIHSGVTKTERILRRYTKVTSLKGIINDLSKKCEVCNKEKDTN